MTKNVHTRLYRRRSGGGCTGDGGFDRSSGNQFQKKEITVGEQAVAMAAACSFNHVFGVKNGTNKFSLCGMIKETKENNAEVQHG